MNCVATALELNQYGVQTDIPVVGNSYMTEPMPVVTLPAPPINEEEVYSSFEEALSERQQAQQWKLHLLSNSSLQAVCNTDALAQHNVTSTQTNVTNAFFFKGSWRRGLIFVSMALILILTGFDLMGLLILHTH
ncbi:MAG TPA: hypothetical protein VFU49_14430 [Ktedonobacteraceae bacterium]|nr:hypothetical protein [Ktedonobacteraceae bacterium]